MIQVEFETGQPQTNSEMNRLARRAVRFWNFRKRQRRLSAADYVRDSALTVRETSVWEVYRRLDAIKKSDCNSELSKNYDGQLPSLDRLMRFCTRKINEKFKEI